MFTNPTRLPKTELILRVGVAFSFIYPAISAWFNPYSWIGYFPGFILDIAGNADITVLHIFGIFEIIIGVWILFGKNIRIPSLIATVSLAGIILFNWNQMDVIFRDIPIMLMAIILTQKQERLK